jgi:hypothetical protein
MVNTMSIPSPRGAVAALLWECGFPATMLTPLGTMPAHVVWVDDPNDALLPLARRAFGGHLVLGMRDHHGEPSPAFWVGVGRSAALAWGVVLAALEGADDERSAAVAGPSRRLARAAPSAWAAAREAAPHLVRPPRDERPAPPSVIAPLVERLNTVVAAELPIAPHIVDGLRNAMTSVLSSREFAVELALPTARERDAWAAGFWRSRRA